MVETGCGNEKKNLSRAPLSSSGSSLHYRGGNGSLTSVGMWIVDWGGERDEGFGVVGRVEERVGEKRVEGEGEFGEVWLRYEKESGHGGAGWAGI